MEASKNLLNTAITLRLMELIKDLKNVVKAKEQLFNEVIDLCNLDIAIQNVCLSNSEKTNEINILTNVISILESWKEVEDIDKDELSIIKEALIHLQEKCFENKGE